MNPHPTLLQRKSVPKPWGRLDLPHPFEGTANEQIGEVWFEHRHPLFGMCYDSLRYRVFGALHQYKF